MLNQNPPTDCAGWKDDQKCDQFPKGNEFFDAFLEWQLTHFVPGVDTGVGCNQKKNHCKQASLSSNVHGCVTALQKQKNNSNEKYGSWKWDIAWTVWM